MSAQVLRIGLLAHTRLQLRTLSSLVEECGYQLGTCLLIPELEARAAVSAKAPEVSADAWVAVIEPEASEAAIDAEDSSQQSDRFHQWVDGERWLKISDRAIIFCDGAVPSAHESQYPAWSRRIKTKLNQLSGAINLDKQGSAPQVWVLAASTGGPAAVKEFLAELPPQLDVGFVYVQHIDTGFKDTLAQVISRGSHYPAHVIQHGAVVCANEVGIVSPDYATELLSNGTFIVNPRPWSASYTPSADYIVASVAHSYGKRSGVIVFTGMGDDAAAGSRMMRQKGGKVWVQSPDTCTSDSMPSATLATGCVDFEGSPVALAQHFVRERTSSQRQSSAVSFTV